MKTLLNVLATLLILATIFFSGYCLRRIPEPNIQIDTLIMWDTVRLPPPPPERVWLTRVDSIPYPVQIGDTITETVYVPVPIERKEYRTENYFAVIEGFRPELISIETYNKTVYINKTETFKIKPRWGIGLQAGVGYSFNGKVSPYIGVGVQYNLITW